MSACRFIASDQPRMLRTHLRDCNASGCEGCQPCEKHHCDVCGMRHVDTLAPEWVCPSCVGDVRTDLSDIVTLHARLLAEATHRGALSEAAMLYGPAADPCLWSWHRIEEAKRLGDWALVEDDPNHPEGVLGTWAFAVEEHYDHERTGRVTVESAAAYLKANLTELAADLEFAFDELAREVRCCRGHLEDVLRDGERPEKGAPCPMCGGPALVHAHGATEDEDRWMCPRRDCNATYTEHDYRTKVEAVYVLHAEALTASQIATTYRVPEGSVRGWASLGKVKRHGKDGRGLALYDVADVLAVRDGTGTIASARD